MKRSIRILAIAVVAVAVLVGVLAAAAHLLSERKANRVIKLDVAPVAYATGADVIREGKYLYESRGCVECHSADGRGKVFINDPNGLYVQAPNISPTADGVTAKYTERDWVRTIRHGVSPQGRPLIIMPSEDYNRLTDADLAALVAYIRSLPAAPGEGAKIRLPVVVRALYAAGVVQDAAEKIDHTLPPPNPVRVAATAEHGAYLANMCIGCHGATLSGGKIPGAPPDWPAAANLTSGQGSAMPSYASLDNFKSMMRTGKRPDGSAVSSVMPFDSLKTITDVDLEAIHVYLNTLPPKAQGNR
jgi:mono/diheme cytochrome c family protein